MSGTVLPNLGLTGDIADSSTWGTEGRANDRRLDALVMLSVKDHTAIPPASPLDGDRYLPATGATGLWANQAGNPTQWNAPLNVWVFYTAKVGWELYLEDEDIRMRYGTQGWYKIEPTISVRNFGVTGDGVTDDRPALNTLFDYVKTLTTGPTTVYFPKGTYLIKGIVVPDGLSAVTPISGLRIVGEPGAIIKAATAAQGGIWTPTRSAMFSFRTPVSSTDAATDIIIEGLIFEGNGETGGSSEVAGGIYTTAMTGLTIRNCTFKTIGNMTGSNSARNDGILLGDNRPSTTVSTRTKDVLIKKCRFINCARNGISMLDVDGVAVKDCYFSGFNHSGIDVEPNDVVQFARDIHIDNCKFDGWDDEAIVVIPGAALATVNYPEQMAGLKITNCQMRGLGTAVRGILVYNWIDVVVHNNSVMNVTDQGIQVRGCVLARITNNGVQNVSVAGSTGIQIDQPQTVQPTDCVVSNNTVRNVGGYGIRILDLNGGSVSFNTIRHFDLAVGSRRGIDVDVVSATCRNVLLLGNLITGSPATGSILTVVSAPTAGGTGYVQGDILTVTTGGTLGKVRVDSVSSGVVTTITTTPEALGSGYTTGAGKVTSGGTGTGCTINIATVASGPGGKPVQITVACTHILCVGNTAQENANATFSDAIDNDAASTIHGFNCDDQRSTRPFSSSSGTTPISGDALGLSSATRKTAYEVTVAAAAAAGTVSTVSDVINSASICNVIFSPINVAAAAMVGSVVGVYCNRTATGFDLIHNGNGAAGDAIFMCMGVVL